MANHIALAKGRIHKVVMKYLAESGYDFPTYSEESRKLIFEDAKGQLKVTLVKSPDVAVYVERGAADVGIVGKDVLIEEAPGADVYEVMDLGIGRCRMAVAGIAGKKVDMTKAYYYRQRNTRALPAPISKPITTASTSSSSTGLSNWHRSSACPMSSSISSKRVIP